MNQYPCCNQCYRSQTECKFAFCECHQLQKREECKELLFDFWSEYTDELYSDNRDKIIEKYTDKLYESYSKMVSK